MRLSTRHALLLAVLAAAVLLIYHHSRVWRQRVESPLLHTIDFIQDNKPADAHEVMTDDFKRLPDSKATRRDAAQVLGQAASRVTEVSCAKLFAGDLQEQYRALSISRNQRAPADWRPDGFYANATCPQVKRRLVMKTLSEEEASFPLAFSILTFKDFFQAEKLFRAIYRPEHFYCLHIDAKSSPDFSSAASHYARCLPNVVLANPRQDVRWGTFSVLEADLQCMRQLLTMSRSWRYFINLTGQEYPLRTMLELVRILKALNGANNLENAGRLKFLNPLPIQQPTGGTGLLHWYKGSVHITVTRGFVEFAVSKAGREISDRLKNPPQRIVADETFFATLNHNPDVLPVPGADKTGLPTDNVRHPFLNRYKNWMLGVFGYPCLSNKVIRQICIWGVQDLPAMNRRFELFANKFYYDFQRIALQCMEERFWNHSMADYGAIGYTKLHNIPLHFYSDFEFVHNHV